MFWRIFAGSGHRGHGNVRGVSNLIQSGKRDVGTALVSYLLIKAFSCTGSLMGGPARFNICTQRDGTIWFFGVLGVQSRHLQHDLGFICQPVAVGRHIV